jgi:Protein of unknown function (DUF4236)
MAFRYQKRIKTGKNSWLNLSKSGVSGSAKVGPVTFNSRGRKTIRLGNGLSYRMGSNSGCASMIALWVIVGAAAITFVARLI